MKPALLVVLLALAAAGCQTAAVAPLPPPLPEALAWQVPAGGGAFLGLDTEENSGDSLDALTFEPGVRVVHAVENSPAARSGVVPGDVLLALDERPVDDPGALDALVQRAGSGTRVVLSVLRGDTAFDVPVVLTSAGGAIEPPEPRYRIDPLRSRAGWTTDRDGVRLVTSAPDGPFPRDGVPVGSVVLSIDGKSVLSDRELVRRLDARPPGDTLTVRARLPGGAVVESEVELYEQPWRVTGFGLPVLVQYSAAADGSSASFSLIDLWILQLFQYKRDREERRWVLLELFGYDVLHYSTGMGELGQ